MIRAVLFDFGGVLTEGGTKGSLARLVANTMGVTRQDALRAGPLVQQLVAGAMSTEEFLQALTQLYPDSPKPSRAKLLKNAEIFTPSPQVYKLAQVLREHGIRTAILSNMFVLSADELRKQGLYDGFDPVILSCTEHVAKPDQAIYQRTIDALQLAPEEILFIDDQERFLQPARDMGMHVLCAESPDQIVTGVYRMVFDINGFSLP
jgi:putative hydrolase of the HAD superfamily